MNGWKQEKRFWQAMWALRQSALTMRDLKGVNMKMEMGSSVPTWWTPVAWIYLLVCLVSAGVLLYQVYGRGQKPQDRVMAPIWPISALFLGPIAFLLYARWGQGQSGALPADERAPLGTGALIVMALLPGAAASTLAHLVGVPVVFGAGWTIAGLALWAVALFILVLATALLFVFEYLALSQARQDRPTGRQTASLFLGSLFTVLAFDLGMVGWMLFLFTTDTMKPTTNVVFTLQMQVGMVLGMLTAAPIAAWLVAKSRDGREARTTLTPPA